MARLRLKLTFRCGECRKLVAIVCVIGVLFGVVLGETKSLQNTCSEMMSMKYWIKESKLKTKSRIRLPVNQHATISSSIKDIWHLPSEKAICIELHNNTSCQNPSFVGRLAGQSLAMLDWKMPNNDERFGPWMRCGSYQDRWLSAGTYFLDILVIFCEEFGVNSFKRVQNESEWLSFDFKPLCMEDPTRNRITGEDSYVVIEENIESSLSPMGRWIPPTSLESILPMPLYHRYQPHGCLRNPNQEMCEKATNGTTLWSYSFEWQGDFGEQWRQKINASNEPTNFPKTCFFGFSHGRELTTAFQRIGLGDYAAHIEVKYPEDVTPALLNNSYNLKDCRALIIAVAQWPGSRFQGFPYLFDRYYNGVKAIVESAAEVFADRADNVRVYMRSIHEIPICDRTASCPMSDWRSPDVLHGYSYLVEKAVQEVRKQNEAAKKVVHFLNTSFIIGPMWDSAPDWGHFPHPVSDEEAMYMASVVSSNA